MRLGLVNCSVRSPVSRQKQLIVPRKVKEAIIYLQS